MWYYIIIFIYIYIIYIIIRYCIAYLLINSSLRNLWRGKRYIIYNTFIKILRADFLHDRYELIKSTQEDIIRDAGLSGSIKEYIDKYIDMGVVHPEDAVAYRDFTNPDKVLEHFRNNKKSLRLRFRRLLDGEYKWMELVVSKSKDYSDEIPVFIYYLREVRYIYEDTMVSEIEKKKQTIYSQGK